MLSDRQAKRASSKVVLVARVVYISDPSHPDHSGKKKKTIYPARNYNVPGNDQSPEAFIREVVQLDNSYQDLRFGKMGKGSSQLFGELIYSTEPGAWLTNEERDEIERRIVSRFGGMAVCRTAWHVDEKTGRCDLHVLISAKNLDYPPKMTLWAEFGGTDQDHIYAAMDSLDTEITRYLNRTPERKKAKLQSAKRRHRNVAFEAIGPKQPICLTLAKHLFKTKMKPEEIDEKILTTTIESIGHEVVGPIGRSASVIFKGRKRPRRFNLESLKDETIAILERLKNDNPGDIG